MIINYVEYCIQFNLIWNTFFNNSIAATNKLSGTSNVEQPLDSWLQMKLWACYLRIGYVEWVLNKNELKYHEWNKAHTSDILLFRDVQLWCIRIIYQDASHSVIWFCPR